MEHVGNELKRVMIISMMMFLFIIILPFGVKNVNAATIASGNSGTVKWSISDAGTFTLKPISGETGVLGDWVTGYYDQRTPWIKKCDIETIQSIKTVKIIGTIKLKTGNFLFAWFQNATSMDLSGLDTTGVTDMSQMFLECKSLTNIDLSSLDTSAVTDMSFMFDGCEGLTSIDLSGFDTRKVRNMYRMFISCSSLTKIDLSMLKTPNLTNVSGMLGWCENLRTVNMSGFNTSNVTDFSEMFAVTGITSLDLRGMNTAKALDMACMFTDCRKLKEINVSSFNTSRVSNMYAMFDCCFALENLDITNFNVSNAKDMQYMLSNLRSLQSLKLGTWKTSQVKSGLKAGFPCDMEDISNGVCYNMDQVIPDGSGRIYKRDYYPNVNSSFYFKYFKNNDAYNKHLSKKMNRVYKNLKDKIDYGSVFPIPGLDITYTRGICSVAPSRTFIPQGICKAGDYTLITAYDDKGSTPSVIYVLEGSGNSLESTITLPNKYHVGGIAFDGSRIWITGDTSDKYLKKSKPFVQYFSYKTLQYKAGKNVCKLNSSDLSAKIYIKNKPSFLEYDSGKLWVGTYINNNDKNDAYIYGYPIINESGKKRLNTNVHASVTGLPSSSQGADINGNYLYVSSSYNGKDKAVKSSHIRKYDISAVKNTTGQMNVKGKAISTVEVPKMNEEILISDGVVRIVFESASEKWKSAAVNTDRVLPVELGLWG